MSKGLDFVVFFFFRFKSIEFQDLWISVYLYLGIFYLLPYLGNEKSYQRSTSVKTTVFYWISNIELIISGTKGATEGRKGQSQAGPKALHLEVGTLRAPRLLIKFLFISARCIKQIGLNLSRQICCEVSAAKVFGRQISISNQIQRARASHARIMRENARESLNWEEAFICSNMKEVKIKMAEYFPPWAAWQNSGKVGGVEGWLNPNYHFLCPPFLLLKVIYMLAFV